MIPTFDPATRRPDEFLIYFTPQPDITTFELALIFGLQASVSDPCGGSLVTHDAWDKMGPRLQRHWTRDELQADIYRRKTFMKPEPLLVRLGLRRRTFAEKIVASGRKRRCEFPTDQEITDIVDVIGERLRRWRDYLVTNIRARRRRPLAEAIILAGKKRRGELETSGAAATTIEQNIHKGTA